jgi:CHAT domain-containing protein
VTRPGKKSPLSEAVLSELAGLTDDAGRSRFLARRRQLYRASVVQQLNDTARTKLRIDTHQSLSLAEAAVAIARKLRNQLSLGRSLRAKANALYVIGDNRLALQCNEQALRIFRKARNAEEEARTLNASIQPFLLLGEYDRALEAAEGARRIFSRLGDLRRLAHVEINVGNVHHRQDSFEEAVNFYERAYEMLLPLGDAEGLGVALYNTSVSLISLNDFPRALSTYQRAREVFDQRGMTLLVGQADYNIAYLYYLRGEYGRAIEMLRAAREKAEVNGDAHILSLCYLDLSDIYLELNLSAEAAEVAHEAFVRFGKLGMGYEQTKSLSNEAIALSQQGKALQALDLFVQARAGFVREKNHVWPWLIDLYRALVLFKEGRLFEARSCCEKALEYFRSSALPGKAVLCHLLLARIDLATGDAHTARKHCGEAIERLSGLEMPILDYQANFLIGQAYAAAGEMQSAYSSYQQAREALETLRSSLRKDELKIAFMKNKTEVYERLVEICLTGEKGQSAFREAFEYMELAKSRSLMDMIFQGAHTAPEVPAGQSGLVRRIRDLREELNWYYHRIELEQLRPEESSPERIEQLKTGAQTREKSLMRVLRELPDSEPEAVFLRGSQGVPLEDIQAALPKDSTLLEYYAAGNQLLAVVLTRDALEIHPVTLLPRVAGMLQMLRSQLAKFRLGEDYLRRFERPLFQATQHHLQELYVELLEPVRGRLAGNHLIVVPHGILHSLPFHALFDGEQYLIDSYSLSYAPSASIYSLCQRRTSPSGNSSLVLGVPDAQAPSIGEEVVAVASALNSAQLFIGDAATEQVLRERGPGSRLIHLATHGNFRQDNPMFSGIRLGQSFLSLVDLYQLRLPAELITLSGCATGLNVVAAGDELLGLIRGLLGAGAQCLLLALWDVHDRSTTEFMTSFYESLKKGETKAQALQSAMKDVRTRYPHPYYWAPFFLAGKASNS